MRNELAMHNVIKLYSKAKLLNKGSILNQLEELKSILQNELQNLKSSLMKNRAQEGDATDRLLSRLTDRNDIIRINTIEWVLKIIAKLENR